MAKKLTAQQEADQINQAVDQDNPELNATVQEATSELADQEAFGEKGELLTEAEQEADNGRPELRAALERVKEKMGISQQAHAAAQDEMDALSALLFGGDEDDEDETLGDEA